MHTFTAHATTITTILNRMHACIHKGNVTGGGFLYNHNWVEYYDDVQKEWVVYNVPSGGGDVR